jgi:hypothetical protein
MNLKIQIKSILGVVLFEYEKSGNTILDTIQEAVEKKADLTVADLRGADLTGADLRGAYITGADLTGADLTGADLRGADLTGAKIKKATVFTGLYRHIVIAYITESNEKRIKMGCYDRSLTEWEADFWNNNNEFPNDGSKKSQLRLMAYNTAKAWFDIVEVKKGA